MVAKEPRFQTVETESSNMAAEACSAMSDSIRQAPLTALLGRRLHGNPGRDANSPAARSLDCRTTGQVGPGSARRDDARIRLEAVFQLIARGRHNPFDIR
jgi:hypothetical protein